MKVDLIGQTLEVRLTNKIEVALLDEGEGLIVPILYGDGFPLGCNFSLKVGGSVFEGKYKEGMTLLPSEEIDFINLQKVLCMISSEVMNFLKEPFKYDKNCWSSQRSIDRIIEIYPPKYN